MRFHGDMLLTTPVISTLKRHYPEAKIDVLLYQDTIPILSENPEINALYGIKNKKAKTTEKITNFVSLIRVLRSNKYDLVVNMADQWMVAVLVRLLNVPMSISQNYQHRQSAFWRNSFTHLAPQKGENVVEANLSVLAPLGLDSSVAETTMSYNPACWTRVRGELDKAGVGERYVVIQPTARQIFKCWENEKFAKVVDALHQRGVEVVHDVDVLRRVQAVVLADLVLGETAGRDFDCHPHFFRRVFRLRGVEGMHPVWRCGAGEWRDGQAAGK